MLWFVVIEFFAVFFLWVVQFLLALLTVLDFDLDWFLLSLVFRVLVIILLHGGCQSPMFMLLNVGVANWAQLTSLMAVPLTGNIVHVVEINGHRLWFDGLPCVMITLLLMLIILCVDVACRPKVLAFAWRLVLFREYAHILNYFLFLVVWYLLFVRLIFVMVM